jgi:hypothetical protein
METQQLRRMCTADAKEPLPLEQVRPHHVGDDALVRDPATRVEEGQVAVPHQQRWGAATQVAVRITVQACNHNLRRSIIQRIAQIVVVVRSRLRDITVTATITLTLASLPTATRRPPQSAWRTPSRLWCWTSSASGAGRGLLPLLGGRDRAVGAGAAR